MVGFLRVGDAPLPSEVLDLRGEANRLGSADASEGAAEAVGDAFQRHAVAAGEGGLDPGEETGYALGEDAGDFPEEALVVVD